MSDREQRALDLLRRVRPTIERLGHMGAEDGCPACSFLTSIDALLAEQPKETAHPTHAEQPEPKVGETWMVPGGKVVDIHTSPSGTRLVTLSEYGHVHGRVFMAGWLRAHGRRVGGE